MVAEEAGTIKVIDLRSRKVTCRLSIDQTPLRSADWSPLRVEHISCVGGDQWYWWAALLNNNLSQQTATGSTSCMSLNSIRFSNTDENLLVACGQGNNSSVFLFDKPTDYNQNNPSFNSRVLKIIYTSSKPLSNLSWCADINCVSCIEEDRLTLLRM